MRKIEQLHVRTVYNKFNGEPVIVDDETFNPEWHSEAPPAKERASRRTSSKESAEPAEE